MNKILLLSLLTLVASETISDDLKGPAAHPKHYESEKFCVDMFPWDEIVEKWYDELDTTTFIPQGVSDCVDTLMWDKWDNRYYDRCCYVRFQFKGEMHMACMSLTEEQYSDISESIRKMEEGNKRYWLAPAGTKIYQLDCNSSYLKLLSFATILLALIF